MSRRKNLVALGPDVDPAEASVENAELADPATVERENTVPSEETPLEEAWEEEPTQRNFGWLVSALAVVAIAAWTGFFGWLNADQILSGAAPEAWAQWIVDWSIPVLLVVTTCILVARNSTKEAKRFGETARMLSTESSALEERLSHVNRELSLARDFIASQALDLESLGRVATERLTTNADRLQELIRSNGEQVSAIGQVSDTALSNMDKLRDQLPVISNSARDVASQIGNAGSSAQGHVTEMAETLSQLDALSSGTSIRVTELGEKLKSTLEALEISATDLDQRAKERFEAFKQENEEFRQELEARETDVLASIRRRARDLSTEMSSVSEQNRELEEAAVAEMRTRLYDLRDESQRLTNTMRDGQQETIEGWMTSVETLKDRMAQIISEISRIEAASTDNARRRMEALTVAGKQMDQSMHASAEAFEAEVKRRRDEAIEAEAATLSALEERLDAIDAKVGERQEEHLAHMSGLSERGEALAARLAGLDREMARLAEQGRNESSMLEEKTEALAEKLTQSRDVLEQNGNYLKQLTSDSVRLLELIRSSTDHSEGALSDAIGSAENRLSQFEGKASALRAIIAEAEAKGSTLEEHVKRTGESSISQLEVMEGLEARLATLADQSSSLAEQARTELQSAISTLEQTSTETIAQLRSGQTETIREIAENIGTQGGEAVEAAIRRAVADSIIDLERSTALAGERGRATTSELRDQLARVNELAGNLEQRVAHAREQAEQQVDSDFTRHMALITESLHSSSIDISKALDTEVSDDSWNSYLRGDRGIFTRRAVRLLSNQEARGVAEVYQNDSEVRESVNRYIHDFEGMLRNILSTREGNAIAVTLLSSDIGKLYVALAQGIERLRD